MHFITRLLTVCDIFLLSGWPRQADVERAIKAFIQRVTGAWRLAIVSTGRMNGIKLEKETINDTHGYTCRLCTTYHS